MRWVDGGQTRQRPRVSDAFTFDEEQAGGNDGEVSSTSLVMVNRLNFSTIPVTPAKTKSAHT